MTRSALAGAVGVVLVAWAAVARLAPVGEEARRERREELVASATAAIERDAELLRATAARIGGIPDFAEIVDGGGAELRPDRLYAVLSRHLPDGTGWGALFADPAGRAVAWAGEAPDEGAPPSAGLHATFHVTRFTLLLSVPRTSSGIFRGTLLVCRRYPTGIVRPDLAEFLGAPGAPSFSSVRAQAARPPALIALVAEPGRKAAEEEEVRRRRALFPAAAAGLLFALLAFRSPAPWAGTLAARLVLLLGTPIAPAGAWGLFGADASGLRLLLSTPADVLLTGLALVLAARPGLGTASPGDENASPGRLRGLLPSLGAAARSALGLAVLVVPWAAGRWAEASTSGLAGGLDLLPSAGPEFLVRTGLVALAAGAFAAGARLLPPLVPEGGVRAVVSLAGGAALLASLALRGRPAAGAVAVAGSFLLAAALAGRRTSAPLLSRVVGASVFLLGGALGLASGFADGRVRQLDARLAEADPSSSAAGIAHGEDEGPSRFEGRLDALPAGAWLPAGSSTDVSDLARAAWVRGADAAFPRAEDVLTVRDATGRVLSSYGLSRPGTARPLEQFSIDSPVPGTTLWISRDRGSRLMDRDPLLAAAAERDSGPRPLVERGEYDAAGRPSGARAGERRDLPAPLLAEARRTGTASGDVDGARTPSRVRVRTTPAGAVSFSLPGEGPLSAVARAVAPAELSLPLLLPLLLAPGARRRGDGPALSRTVRSGRGFLSHRTFRGRLLGLLVLAGALPLAVGVVAVRAALERSAVENARTRAVAALSEARRLLAPDGGETVPDEEALSRAATVLGTDLLLYREGSLVAASRALPVAALVAPPRLPPSLASRLAEGQAEASAASAVAAGQGGTGRGAQAAVALSRGGREALAVVLSEDEAGRRAVDGLVLLAVGVAVAAVLAGGKAAVALSRPLEEVAEAAGRLGRGEEAGPIDRPGDEDLARLVDAFAEMAGKVRERTEGLARERAAAVGLLSNLTAAALLFREADGEVLLSNTVADALLPGRGLTERLSPPEWEPLRLLLARWRGQSPVETRVSVGSGGAERVWRVAIAPIPGTGPERRVVLLLEDLTDFVRAERLTAWVEAARAIAHDIRNPLTPVRLTAERLRRLATKSDAVPSAETEGAADVILRQVNVLTERIGRLKWLSGGGATGPASPALGEAEARTLLEELAADYAVPGRVEVVVEVDRALPPVLAGRELLRDALSNFLVNSLEAIGEGSGRIALAAHAAAPAGDGEEPAGALVTFSCEDDGPGVREAQFSLLFEPSFTTKSRGSGMGLFVTRRAVERAGGEVFASRPASGRGLLVGVRIPAA